MHLLTTYFCTTLILVTAFSSARAQAGEKVLGTERDTSATSQTRKVTIEEKEAQTPALAPESAMIWIHLVGGRRMQVDEVTEVADGIWYKQGTVSTFVDRARVERIERSEDANPNPIPDTFAASGKWSISDWVLHNRWGLDHRNGMDVGLHPDSLEGKALIKFLLSEGTPFLAFRGPVPGVATGPHIHIGNGSKRLHARL